MIKHPIVRQSSLRAETSLLFFRLCFAALFAFWASASLGLSTTLSEDEDKDAKG